VKGDVGDALLTFSGVQGCWKMGVEGDMKVRYLKLDSNYQVCGVELG
jgi:hypothetical protein